MEITDNSVKLLNAHHHYNLGRSVFLKRSRHHYSHQYSRRNLGNHGNGSSSLGKGPPSREERLSFKLASHCNTEPGSHAGNMVSYIRNYLVISRTRHIYGCILWIVPNHIIFCVLTSFLEVGMLSAHGSYFYFLPTFQRRGKNHLAGRRESDSVPW